MMRLLLVVVASGLSLAADPVVQTPESGDDTQQLQGVWRGRSLVIKGNSVPPTCAQSLWLRFEKDTFTIEQGGKITAQGRYTIDPTSQPKTIDLTITDTVQTVNKGAVVLGIYALEKGKLTLCTTKTNDQTRPQKLVSKYGIPHSLFTFQKEMPPEAPPSAVKSATPAKPAH